MVSFHKLNAEKFNRMTQSSKVLVNHTNEQGKSDYIINPYYYFCKSIADDYTFKTEDRQEEDGSIIRVIYALNKDGVPYYNTFNEIRPLKDDTFKSGKICIECLNPIPPIKNEYTERLACKCCNKCEIRTTRRPIKKVDCLG